MQPTTIAPSELLPVLDVPRIPKQRRSRRKYERLFAAGMGVFEEYGYYQTTVDAITAGAKVSTGTFYSYFRDKRQLLVLLVGELLDSLAFELRALDLSTDPVSALEPVVEEFVVANRNSCGIWQAWKESSTHDAELAAYDRKIDAWVRTLLVAAMDRTGNKGGLRPALDRAVAARAITALLWQLPAERGEEPEGLVRAVTQLLCYTLFLDR